MTAKKKTTSRKKKTRSKTNSPDLFSFIPQQSTKKTTKKTTKKVKKKTSLKVKMDDTEKPEGKRDDLSIKKKIKKQKISKKDQKNDQTKTIKSLNKSDLNFYKKDETPFGEKAFSKGLQEELKREAHKSRYLRYLIENDMICKNMEQGMLLTVEYCGTQNKAYAKFYDLDDKKIKFWIDNTGHQPYCLHKDSKDTLENNLDLTEFFEFDRIETITKYDLLADKEIEMSKVFAKTPSKIGGSGENTIKSILGGAWEANIRYHHNYIFDEQLIPGLIYCIKNGKLDLIEINVQPEMEKQLMGLFKEEKPEFQKIAKKYMNIFSSPIPDISRVAFDIEVEVPKSGRLPNTKLAKQAIISISFSSSDGMNKVYVLWNDDVPIGNKLEEFPENAEILFFDNEKDLLLESFRIIWSYPLVISFNGDNFDFNYMFHRADRLKIEKGLNPIQIARGGGGMVSSYAYLKYGVHLDLYQVFANRSLKGYAFGARYDRNSLDHITKAFLDSRKFKHDSGDKKGEKFSANDIANLDLHTLAHYNMMDSVITLDLTRFGDNTVWNLLVYLMRITKLPFQDLFRHQISFWIRSLLFYEHRARNYLIPRVSEIRKKKPGGIGKSVINGKGFQGAYVIDPVPGIHFDVVVADFSSLYPSIIKTRNLSYETISCNHDECSSNFLPDTPYHVCTKREGIFALVVGFFRDIRVKWFKPRSSDKKISENERNFANILQSALKVFVNGSYGVFGSPNFPLYCLPVAEATTTIGRYSIKETIDKAESMGVRVLYGDTDSVFLDNPKPKQIQQIIDWSIDHLKIDLEEEKTYQFLALSERKKNYVGIYKDSLYIDIKGMTAKKSNTAPFINKAFKSVSETLKKITNMEEYEENKKEIIKKIKRNLKLIGKPVESGGFPITDYAITIGIKKAINQYTKNIPQHIRAAKKEMLLDPKVKYERGDVVSFIKAKNKDVKPLTIATITDIDQKKYKELLKGTFEQLLDALGMSFEELEGTKKLDSFF
ncbi:MAG: DNA-directed DNA polymerase I [archaeon]|nr:DNA-directed DNA polymerase I [archaeon]